MLTVEPQHFGRTDRTPHRSVKNVVQAPVTHDRRSKQVVVNLIGESDRGDRRLAVGAGRVGYGKHCCDDVARVSASVGIGVVALHITGHHAVRKSREFRQSAMGRAEYTGPGWRAGTQRYFSRDPARFGIKCAEPAAQRIEYAPLAFVDDRSRQVGETQCACVISDTANAGVHGGLPLCERCGSVQHEVRRNHGDVFQLLQIPEAIQDGVHPLHAQEFLGQTAKLFRDLGIALMFG